MVLVTVPSVSPTVIFIVVQAFGACDGWIVLGPPTSSAGLLGLVRKFGSELLHQCLECGDLFGLAACAVHVVWWWRELCWVERREGRWGPLDVVRHVWLKWLGRDLVHNLLYLGRDFIQCFLVLLLDIVQLVCHFGFELFKEDLVCSLERGAGSVSCLLLCLFTRFVEMRFEVGPGLLCRRFVLPVADGLVEVSSGS